MDFHMSKAIILSSCSDYWEGLFVDGKLVMEGHTLNEGYKRIPFLKKLGEEYGFSVNDIEEYSVTDEYDELLNDCGGFHQNIEDVQYEHE